MSGVIDLTLSPVKMKAVDDDVKASVPEVQFLKVNKSSSSNSHVDYVDLLAEDEDMQDEGSGEVEFVKIVKPTKKRSIDYLKDVKNEVPLPVEKKTKKVQARESKAVDENKAGAADGQPTRLSCPKCRMPTIFEGISMTNKNPNRAFVKCNRKCCGYFRFGPKKDGVFVACCEADMNQN